MSGASPLRVVVVDDDHGLRDALSRTLLGLGHQPTCFPSVAKAVQHLSSNGVDLIMLDLRMPEIDGFVLLRNLRQRGHAIPVLVMSGHPRRGERREIEALDAHFLPKPFSPSQLATALRKLVGGVAPSTVSGTSRRDCPVEGLCDSFEAQLEKGGVPILDPRVANIHEVLMHAEPPGATELMNIMGNDPRLLSEVLRVANTAQYRSSGRATMSLRGAIVRLGAREVVGIVLRLMLKGSFAVADPALQGLLDGYWKDSVACASECRSLAQLTDLDPNEAYSLGLLHDVGRLFVVCVFDAVRPPGLDARELADAHHEKAGAKLLKAWEMPATIIEVAKSHHGSAEHLTPIAALVRLASMRTATETPIDCEPELEAALVERARLGGTAYPWLSGGVPERRDAVA